VVLNNDLNQIVQKFSEHYHDAWASRKLENGWTYGDQWSDMNKTHPRLKPYNMLSDYERERYKEPVRESLKALLAIGWSVEHAEVDVPSTNRSSMRRSSKSQVREGSWNEFYVRRMRTCLCIVECTGRLCKSVQLQPSSGGHD